MAGPDGHGCRINGGLPGLLDWLSQLPTEEQEALQTTEMRSIAMSTVQVKRANKMIRADFFRNRVLAAIAVIAVLLVITALRTSYAVTLPVAAAPVIIAAIWPQAATCKIARKPSLYAFSSFQSRSPIGPRNYQYVRRYHRRHGPAYYAHGSGHYARSLPCGEPYFASRPQAAASLTYSPLPTGQAAHSSSNAPISAVISASVWTGEGVKRMRSVPRLTVG